MRKVRRTVEGATRKSSLCTVPKVPPTRFIFLRYITSKLHFCRNIHIKKKLKKRLSKRQTQQRVYYTAGLVCNHWSYEDQNMRALLYSGWLHTRTCTFIYFFSFSFTVSKQIERFEMRLYDFQCSEINRIPCFLLFFFFSLDAPHTARVGGAFLCTHAQALR